MKSQFFVRTIPQVPILPSHILQFPSLPLWPVTYRLRTDSLKHNCITGWHGNVKFCSEFLVRNILSGIYAAHKATFSFADCSSNFIAVFDVLAILITCSITNCSTGWKLYIQALYAQKAYSEWILHFALQVAFYGPVCWSLPRYKLPKGCRSCLPPPHICTRILQTPDQQ